MNMSKKRNNRVLHITLEKCGSQWVRDVLSAPEIVSFSGYPYSGISKNLFMCERLNIPEGTFSGPIYNMNQWEWQGWKRPGDKAIVVLRDPRDVMISKLFSWMYSHEPEKYVVTGRNILHNLADIEARVKHMITGSGLEIGLRTYRTWANGAHDDALVVSYEALVADQLGEFGKIIDWLNWNVPQKILNAVVKRLSFKERSGREPGETDKFSHYRRGVSGDWSNYFTRKHGELLEMRFPGFLREIGYEVSDDWWQSLPENQIEDMPADKTIPEKSGKQMELIDVLDYKLRQIQEELVKKESVIQEFHKIDYVKVAAERLIVIEDLDKIARERLELIKKLNTRLGYLQRIKRKIMKIFVRRKRLL